MNKLAPALLFLLYLSVAQSYARQEATRSITFQVYSPNLADTTKVFVTGSLPDLGFWNPSKVLLKNNGRHVWTKTIMIKKTTSIEYKFTLGSWDREAANANGQPFPNFNHYVKKDTILKHEILFWKKGDGERIITGKITGTVKYHRQIIGDGILPRDIIVWLPPDYNANKNVRYPVLYMHDGQNIIDPATSSFSVDWRIDESVDSLIQNKIIEPHIVVGIYNTKDRSQEYTSGEKGTAYMTFVVDKVKPMIDLTYRTKPEARYTITGGSSAGGLISFMLAWEYPQVFSKAICMSPAFKIFNINYVKTVLSTNERKPVYYYIDNGGIGLESQLQPGIDEMINALRAKGYQPGTDFYYFINLSAKHFEQDWGKRFPSALINVLHAKQ